MDPLIGTLGRLEQMSPYFALPIAEAGPSYRPVAWLAQDIEAAIDRCYVRAGLSDRRMAGLALAYQVGWAVAPAVAAYILESRVPDLSARNVLVRPGVPPGDTDSFALREPLFACLRSDPDANSPGAIPATDRIALASRLHDDVTRGWGRATIGAIHAATPVGVKALWGMYASALASAVTLVAEITGTPDATLQAALPFLSSDEHLLKAPPVFYVLDAPAHPMLRFWRGACCLYYRTLGFEMCEGACPLLPAGRAARRAATQTRSGLSGPPGGPSDRPAT